MAGKEKGGEVIQWPLVAAEARFVRKSDASFASLQLIVDKLVADVGCDEAKSYLVMELVRLRRMK